MLKIAVCEDNLNDLAAIEKIIARINTIKIDLDVFTSGKDLLNTIRMEGNFDIYLLDISLPYINGLEIAEAIRKEDMHSVIIFTAACPDYVFESFEYISFNYLLKPISEDTLKNTLFRAEKYLQRNHHIFHYSFNKVSYSIAAENIFYFQKNGRKAYIHTPSAIKECNMRIEDILSRLDSDTFVQINRSYIINLRHIEIVQKNFVYIANKRISLGAMYQKNFENRYRNYLYMVR